MTRHLPLAICVSVASVVLDGVVVPATASADDETPAVSVYGFARLDVLADDAPMSDIAQPMYVAHEPADRGGELTMTPRLSRVGLQVEPWLLSRHTSGEGRVEVDFAGGDGTGAIRLRHAFGVISLERIVELLAGQTSDLISPLVPSVQNDTQLVFAGNTGDRRPQLQLSIMPGERLRAAIGVAPSGFLSRADADGDGRLDGVASMRPMLQWLIEARQPMRGDVLRLGVWGHVESAALAAGTRHTGWSAGLHGYLPLMRRLVWLGEAYFGSDLADIGGGIGQGYDATTQRAVRGAGGWSELAAMPSAHHVLAVGGSIDTARASDLMSRGRERNATVYGVVRYKPLDALQLGVEYLHWRTRYKDDGASAANRVDVHLSVFF